MEVVYAHEYVKGIPQHSIFLAGPSPRRATDYNWRAVALTVLSRSGYLGHVYVPLPRDGEWSDDYDAQVDWELHYLEAAHAVAFWVPRDLETLPGFTTNVEFGLFARSGKVVLGAPPTAPKMRYLCRVAERFNVPVFHTLPDTLAAAMGKKA